ncbi:hypothetical protein QCA50_004106 [Cerrena zonata]|uniref:Uncharacterized protein n=1 Tax=Cerrena zonata TaxID=2478898 RepID=A0AAW0GGE6_9APHY
MASWTFASSTPADLASGPPSAGPSTIVYSPVNFPEHETLTSDERFATERGPLDNSSPKRATRKSFHPPS